MSKKNNSFNAKKLDDKANQATEVVNDETVLHGDAALENAEHDAVLTAIADDENYKKGRADGFEAGRKQGFDEAVMRLANEDKDGYQNGFNDGVAYSQRAQSNGKKADPIQHVIAKHFNRNGAYVIAQEREKQKQLDTHTAARNSTRNERDVVNEYTKSNEFTDSINKRTNAVDTHHTTEQELRNGEMRLAHENE